MIKKTINYLLLFIFLNLFFSPMWANHVHHNYDTTLYKCINLKYNTDVLTKNICFDYGKGESFLEHLFEKGVLFENKKANSISKIRNNFLSHSYLPINTYKKYFDLQKTYLFTEIDTPKKLLILTLKNPRSPPDYS